MNNKKKAIKIATATAIVASGFVAVAPAQAAVSVADTVANAKKVMAIPYKTYTTASFLANPKVVEDQVKAAKTAYNNAVKVVNKSGGTKKAAYLSQLKTANVNVTRADGYTKAHRIAEKDKKTLEKDLASLNQSAVDQKAIEVKDKYNAILKTVKTARTSIEKVYGTQVKLNLKSKFTVPTEKALEGDIKVYYFYQKAEAWLAKGEIETAEARVKEIAPLFEKVGKTTDLEKAIHAYAESVSKKIEDAKTPVVTGVSAINAKQIKVSFNKAVDEDTIYDLANYSFKLNGSAEATVKSVDASADVTVQADGKSVVITTTTPLETEFGVVQTGTPFNFKVSGVKAATGQTFETTTFEVSVKDAVTPELLSASAKASASTKNVTLTFSEPVDYATTGVFKVNGKVVTPSAGAVPNEVVLTTTDNLLAGQTYSVEVLNLKDYAGNLINANPSTSNVTVQADTNVANITSVTATEDDKVKVVFDKSMNASTLSGSTVTVLNTNGLATGTYSVNAVPGTANKEFTIDFTAGLYSNSNTENLSIVFTNAIKDSSGNAIGAVTKTASLTKDTVDPKVVSSSVLSKGATYDGVAYANGALVVAFDEKVKDPGSTIAAGSSIKVIDQDGTDISSSVTLGNPVSYSKDSKVLVIPFTANTITSASKTATVIISSGITTDASLGNNANTAATFNGINLQAPVADVTKPVVASVSNSSNDITFTITEENLDKATVQNVDNYRLDGKPLPSGSYVTVVTTVVAGDDTHAVTIKLPAGSVDATRSTYAFTVNGIKDLAGNTANVVAVNNLSLTDDVKPVLTSGKVNADGSVTLGYAEAVTGVVTADLVATLNGKVLDTTAVAPTAITAGADAGGTLLTFATAYDAGVVGTAGDETIFVNVAGTGSTAGYDAGLDLVIAQGTYANLAAYGTTVKAADILTLKVATAATGVLTGADSTGNKLANNKSVTVK